MKMKSINIPVVFQNLEFLFAKNQILKHERYTIEQFAQEIEI